jgi:hypothetical protein
MYVCVCVCVVERDAHTHKCTHTRSEVQCNGGTRKVVGEVRSSSPPYAWLSLGVKQKKKKNAKVKPKTNTLTTSFYIPYVHQAGPHFIIKLDLSKIEKPSIIFQNLEDVIKRR